MNEIITNDRFDKLTNLDIATHYRSGDRYFIKSDFTGAFAYWVVAQSPYDAPDITQALSAFSGYIDRRYPSIGRIPELFTYESLHAFINEDIFESIPEIEKLNHYKISVGKGFEDRHLNPHPDYDFIDLGALARNVVFMILRESITQE